MINLTPFLRVYAKIRAAQLEKQSSRKAATETQSQVLLSLINTAKNTDFGRQYDFASIKTVKDYQSRVPLRYYEDFWNEYWKDKFPTITNVTWPGTIPCFSVSSGTTSGTTKYIPYTTGTRNNYQKAGLDLLSHHVLNHPNSRVFSGKNFVLGGSTDLIQQAPGITSGDISGISIINLPWWAKLRYFPPTDLCFLKDWEEKIDKFAKASLSENISMLSGVPSWLLILVERLFQLKPESNGKLSNVFPNLDLLVHGGVNFAPYYKQFSALLEGSSAELREVYPASEGFIAVADRGYGEGMRILIDSGIFYEFVPLSELESESPTRHSLAEVEIDTNYAVVMSTNGGLWSYILGDTVKFVDTEPLRVLVTGRTAYYLSAFGEHLIAEEIEDAVSTAASKIGLSVRDYSVGARYPKSSAELGGHIYVVEFSEGQPDGNNLEMFCDTIDQRLCERNEDYEAHRAEGFGLDKPEVKVVPEGTFAKWMKSRGKLGGQHKVPRIITKQELFNSLVSF